MSNESHAWPHIQPPVEPDVEALLGTRVDALLDSPVDPLVDTRVETRAETRVETRLGASPINVAGLIRRVRRDADLSQTQLARQLNVSQSTIARWENGHAEPTIHMFQSILALADYTLSVRDDLGLEPQPLRDDAPRDEAGRRLPAHLDLLEGDDPETHEFRLNTPHRPGRDRRRARTGCTQTDHPTLAELLARRRARRTRRSNEAHQQRLALKAARQAEARANGEPDPYALPECTCLDACLDAPHCPDHCPCACEPRPPGYWRPEQWAENDFGKVPAG